MGTLRMVFFLVMQSLRGQGPGSVHAAVFNGARDLGRLFPSWSSAFRLETVRLTGALWAPTPDTPFSPYFHLCHSLLLGITQNSHKFTSANTYQAATISRIPSQAQMP